MIRATLVTEDPATLPHPEGDAGDVYFCTRLYGFWLRGTCTPEEGAKLQLAIFNRPPPLPKPKVTS